MRSSRSPILIRLFAYAIPYWPSVIGAWILVFGAAAFMVLMPIFVQYAIDTGVDINSDGIAIGERGTLIWFGVAIVAISALWASRSAHVKTNLPSAGVPSSTGTR